MSLHDGPVGPEPPPYMEEPPPPGDGDMIPMPDEAPGWLMEEEAYVDLGALGWDAPSAASEGPAAVADVPALDPEAIPEAMERCLRDNFGLESFRDGQREVIETVLMGRSAMTVMPTGAGKSLCYQLPAMLTPGITLIISPLIALMKDQVDSLLARGLPATFINSTLSLEEQRSRMWRIRTGELKLVFVAPERFRSSMFWGLLREVRVGLLAVDEAHCISSWGHDFRPDYLALKQVRAKLGDPVTIALTATATPMVQKDIKANLGIEHADTFVSGFERPNLYFEVYKAAGKRDKLNRIVDLLHHTGGPAAVYCSTRKAVEEVGEVLEDALSDLDLKVGIYHAGLSDAQRVEVQDAFMDGEVDVLVATNAFGMGVDKSNIRAIVHYQFPSTLEAYYQEAGRAGRDGRASHCLLLYNYADRRVPDFFIESAHPSREVVELVWETLRRMGTGVHALTNRQLAHACSKRVSDLAVSSAVKLLIQAGHLARPADPSVDGIEVMDRATARQLRVDWGDLKTRRDYEEDKLKKVIFYATTKNCRTTDVLRYFGSRVPYESSCGHCDNCVPPPPYASSAIAPRRRSSSSSSSSSSGGARKPARIKTEDDNLTLCKKIVACVARCRQNQPPKNVVRVLSGSKAKELEEQGLMELSTYGLLSAMKQSEVQTLVDLLIEHRLLEHRGWPLKIAPLGLQVMKGDAALPDGLERALGALMWRPSGMARSGGGASASSGRASGGGSSNGLSTTIEETLELMRAGKHFGDIAREREIQTRTVVGHVIQAVRGGHAADLDLTPYVDGALVPAIRTVSERVDWNAVTLREFREAVLEIYPGGQISYDVLKLNVAYLIQQGELE